MSATKGGQVACGALSQRCLRPSDVISKWRNLDTCFILSCAQHLGEDIKLLITGAQLQICATCSVQPQSSGYSSRANGQASFPVSSATQRPKGCGPMKAAPRS